MPEDRRTTPRLNQQTWANVEDYCRTLVSQGNELYIIWGSYGRSDTGTNGFMTTLDQGRVTRACALREVGRGATRRN